MRVAYLDHAATTPLDPEVRAAMEPFLGDSYGNPSSRHPLGVRAAEALDEARECVARALGGRPDDVVFTSGGTEANNLAVLGLARAAVRARRGGDGAPHELPHVLIGATEHPSVREAALALGEEGFEVERLGLGPDGDVDADELARRLRPTTVLVSHMLVNNEFGTVYSIARLAETVRRAAPGARIHTDAVQGVGKVELGLGALGVDALSLSAHKIHGPKGTGALLLAPGVRPRPLVHGGGQEAGVRSGTENVAGIVGCARAVELAVREPERGRAHLTALRTRLRDGLPRVPGARLLEGATASPAIAAVVLPGAPAEVWMHHLEAAGVMTSAGSACASRSREVSPGLLALGLAADEARQVLRFSLSRASVAEDVDLALAELERVASRLANSGPERAGARPRARR